MLKSIFIFLFIIVPLQVHGYEFMENWKPRDTYLQTTFIAITAIDWMQTRSAARNDWIIDNNRQYETNPFLGKYPSRSRVDTMIGLGILGHTLVAMILPSKFEILNMTIHPRTIWQSFFIAVEITAVSNNHYMGVRIEF